MSGIDVVGIISLSITLFNGCLQGFAILCRAREYDRHVASVRLMLELEQYKLFTWAEEIGLLLDPPQLKIAVPDVQLVNAILCKLRDLLADVQALRFKYGLRIETTAETIEDVDDDPALCQMQVQSLSEVHAWQEATMRVFRARTQPWRKLKWVIVDEQHFRKLLGDISYFTDELYRFLERHKQRDVQLKHDTLLRRTVINTTSQLALNVIGGHPYVLSATQAVAATARFKKKRLRLGFWDRLKRSNSDRSAANEALISPTLMSRQESFDGSLPSPSVESRKLSSRLLNLTQIPQPTEFRQLAYYERQPVLIEWRPILPSTWTQAKDRVERLSCLLLELDVSSFHSLPCRGYVLNQEAGRYGFVFDLSATDTCQTSLSTVATPADELPALPVMETLRARFSIRRPAPALNVRVRYATVLLETVLQLHTAGWLHKELRPDNIVSLTCSDCHANADHTSDSIYIAGYAYARMDDAHEFTEPSQDTIEAQLYRHPLSLGVSRESYCKSFDLFSVGCILLEIGLWSSFSTILTSLSDSRSAPAVKTSKLQVNSDAALQSHPSSRVRSLNATSQPPDQTRRKAEGSSGPNLMLLRRALLRELGIEVPSPISHSHSTSASDRSTTGGASQEATILKVLEAQAGRRYAQVVIDCLQAFSSTKAATGDSCYPIANIHALEDRHVLGLEEKSLKSLRDLLEVL